jgi:hypothetical protein
MRIELVWRKELNKVQGGNPRTVFRSESIELNNSFKEEEGRS